MARKKPEKIFEFSIDEKGVLHSSDKTHAAKTDESKKSLISKAVEKARHIFVTDYDNYEGPSHYNYTGRDEKGYLHIEIQSKGGHYAVDGRETKIEMGKYGGKGNLSSAEYLIWLREQNDQKNRDGSIRAIQTYDGFATLDGGITGLRVPNPKHPEKMVSLTVNQLIDSKYKLTIRNQDGSDVSIDFSTLRKADLTGEQKDALVRYKLAEKIADSYKRFGENFMQLKTGPQTGLAIFAYNVDTDKMGSSIDSGVATAAKTGEVKPLISGMKQYVYARTLQSGKVDDLVSRRNITEIPVVSGLTEHAIKQTEKSKAEAVTRLASIMPPRVERASLIAAAPEAPATTALTPEKAKQLLSSPALDSDLGGNPTIAESPKAQVAAAKVEAAPPKPAEPAAQPKPDILVLNGKRQEIFTSLSQINHELGKTKKRSDDVAAVHGFLEEYAQLKIAHGHLGYFGDRTTTRLMDVQQYAKDNIPQFKDIQVTGKFDQETKALAMSIVKGEVDFSGFAKTHKRLAEADEVDSSKSTTASNSSKSPVNLPAKTGAQKVIS